MKPINLEDFLAHIHEQWFREGGRERAGLEETEPAVEPVRRAVTGPALAGSGVEGTETTDALSVTDFSLGINSN